MILMSPAIRLGKTTEERKAFLRSAIYPACGARDWCNFTLVVSLLIH